MTCKPHCKPGEMTPSEDWTALKTDLMAVLESLEERPLSQVRHLEGSPDESVSGNHAPVQIMRVDLGAPTMVLIITLVVILVAVIGATGAIMGLNLAKQAQMDQDFKDMKTQDWLKERRLMDREAYDIVNGLKKPGDDQNGPTGNLERMKQKVK